MQIRPTSIFAALCLITSTPALAEVFMDVYAGPAHYDTAKVEISSKVAATTREVGFSKSATYGVRAGYWLRPVPWLGIAGDFSSQHARGKNAKFDLAPLSAMVLFRMPLLPDEEIPLGRVQPYLGLGPSVSFYTYASANFGPPTNGFNDWSINFGWQIPAGLTVQLDRNWALFTEYRYTWYKVDVTEPVITFHSYGQDIARQVKTNLSGHNLLFGVSYRF